MPRRSDRSLSRKPADAQRTRVRTSASHDRVALFPTLARVFDPRGPYLIPLLLLFASRVVMMLGTPTPAEDAFITFRYARNLVSGQGLVYNPGEHVMGFTSPLWTVWSALGIAVIGNPIPWATIWSVVADVCTLLVGGALVAATAGTASAWAFTFFFAVWPYFSALAVSGMEMSVCVALLVLSAALVHQRSKAAGPALAALALCRPEGFVAAVVLSLAAGWRDRLVAAGLAGAGIVALVLQFGNPIPNSLLVKASVYGMPGPWAGRHWWEWISPIIIGRWPLHSDSTMMMFLAVVTAPASVLGARELWRRRDSALAPLVAALLAVWLGYAAVGAAYFWWYFAFPLVATSLLVSVGLPHVVRGRAVPIALGLFVLSVWSISLSLYRGRSYHEAQTFGTMAGALRDRCSPGDTTLLEPIGMIGFACPIVVIDETGLVSPEVARRRLQGSGWYTDVVRSRHPRWLVQRRGVIESQNAFAGAGRPFRNASERDALLAQYRVVETSGDTTSENSLMLLQRQP